MNLKNQTYSSYYIEEIDNWGDRRDAVSKFGDKIHDNYHFLFPDNQDLSQALFGKDKFTAIIGEFDLTKHISGHGPTGEIIITRPEVEVPEKVFEDFINLVDPKTNTIFDETILNFTEKYGLLFFNWVDRRILRPSIQNLGSPKYFINSSGDKGKSINSSSNIIWLGTLISCKSSLSNAFIISVVSGSLS